MMEVRVYDAPEGGNLTYSDYIGSVMVTDGIYSFRFGSNGEGIAAALTGQDYLALSVNGIEETTRTRLLAVPYAIKSADAQATIAVLASTGLITPNFSPEMISVMGGSMPGNSLFAGQAVDSFLIGKYEVTRAQFKAFPTEGSAVLFAQARSASIKDVQRAGKSFATTAGVPSDDGDFAHTRG
jgi:hypothetical protein